MLQPLFIVGTRPEAIKLAPVVLACRRSDAIAPVVCNTAQHRELLQPMLEYFGLSADVDLDVMRPNQSLAETTARCVSRIDELLANRRFDCVVAQGDTTTVMAASLAAFYRRVPFVHVEAGLRTGDLLSPWPEELNRRIATLTAALHCAPTTFARDRLLAEGVPAANVLVTGNTVVDALLWTWNRERQRSAVWEEKHRGLGARRLVLITGHRRENLGHGFREIGAAIAELARSFPDAAFVYPVHLNPHVRAAVSATLAGIANVFLIEPVGYPEFVWLMGRSSLILTDSGGVQEEAPSLGKPVLVMRDTTERPEGVARGAARLVGADRAGIVAAAREILAAPPRPAPAIPAPNPYGDGQAAARIVELLLARFGSPAAS